MFIMVFNENHIVYVNHTHGQARFNFQCGHCGRDNSGRVPVVYSHRTDGLNATIRFLFCTSCSLLSEALIIFRCSIFAIEFGN